MGSPTNNRPALPATTTSLTPSEWTWDPQDLGAHPSESLTEPLPRMSEFITWAEASTPTPSTCRPPELDFHALKAESTSDRAVPRSTGLCAVTDSPCNSDWEATGNE